MKELIKKFTVLWGGWGHTYRCSGTTPNSMLVYVCVEGARCHSQQCLDI